MSDDEFGDAVVRRVTCPRIHRTSITRIYNRLPNSKKPSADDLVLVEAQRNLVVRVLGAVQ